MTIKRFNEFPDGSGSLTIDDILLFMDRSTGEVKRISLSQVNAFLGGSGSGNPFDQNLNTTDSPSFVAVILPGTGAYNFQITNTGIVFADGTSLTSASFSTSSITNFNSSVSGLINVKNITAGSGIVVNNNSGNFTVNSSLVSNPSGITGATSITNIVQISQTDYDNLGSYDPNTVYIINT